MEQSENIVPSGVLLVGTLSFVVEAQSSFLALCGHTCANTSVCRYVHHQMGPGSTPTKVCVTHTNTQSGRVIIALGQAHKYLQTAEGRVPALQWSRELFKESLG